MDPQVVFFSANVSDYYGLDRNDNDVTAALTTASDAAAIGSAEDGSQLRNHGLRTVLSNSHSSQYAVRYHEFDGAAATLSTQSVPEQEC